MEIEMTKKEKMDGALNRFLKNAYWKEIYENAPSEKCKEYYNIGFCCSIGKYSGDEFNGERARLVEEMDVKDLEYLLGHESNQRLRSNYKAALNKRLGEKRRNKEKKE